MSHLETLFLDFQHDLFYKIGDRRAHAGYMHLPFQPMFLVRNLEHVRRKRDLKRYKKSIENGYYTNTLTHTFSNTLKMQFSSGEDIWVRGGIDQSVGGIH